jgi:cell wall-associated NlpC family hydrolase
MHWSVEFLGIPYFWHGRDETGADCWGICRLVYDKMLGLEIPAYSEACTSDQERAEIAAQFENKSAPLWIPVEKTKAEEFDIVVFSLGGRDAHAGLAINAYQMLHLAEGLDSCIETFTSEKWCRRLSGVYRHYSRLKL